MTLDPALSLPLAWFLAATLGLAGAHKLLRREQFLDAMSGYGLVPGNAARMLAPVLAMGEGIAALLLVIPGTQAVGATLAAVIFAAYGGAMVLAISRGNAGADCGCHFGPTPSKLGWPLVIRNLALIMVAGAVALPLAQEVSWLHLVSGALAGFALVLIHESIRTALANHEWIRALKGAS